MPPYEGDVERLCASKAETGQRRQGQEEGDHGEGRKGRG